MSAPSTSSPSSTGAEPAHSFSSGPTTFGAFLWGFKRLLRAPALLVFVALAGTGLGFAMPVGSEVAATIGVGLANLFVSAVTYRHAGFESGDVEDVRDLLIGAAMAVPKLVVAWVWFLFGLGVIFFLALLGGVIGFLLVLPAVVLFLIHTILAFPAASIDEGLVGALFVAWAVARSARLTLLGLVIVTTIPLAVLETQLTGSDPIAIAGFGALYGVVFGAGNLAFARVYISLR